MNGWAGEYVEIKRRVWVFVDLFHFQGIFLVDAAKAIMS